MVMMMKRRMKYKTYYQMQVVRPRIVYDALLYLKQNNPFYSKIELLPYEEFVKDLEDESEEEMVNEDGNEKTKEDKINIGKDEQNSSDDSEDESNVKETVLDDT